MTENAWTAADRRRMEALTPEQEAQLPVAVEGVQVRPLTVPDGWTATCCTCSAPVTGYSMRFIAGDEIPFQLNDEMGGFYKNRDRSVTTCWPCGHDGSEAPGGCALVISRTPTPA